MITLEHTYLLTGIILFIFTIYTLIDKGHKQKLGTAAFWLLYGITFCFGKYLPNTVTGAIVVLMAIIAALKRTGTGTYNETTAEEKMSSAEKYGNTLFVIVLIVPVVTFAVAIFTKLGALVGMSIGAVIALIVALIATRSPVTTALNEGRRLTDAIGWAAILSQFLAALGALFAKAGVGTVISGLVTSVVPKNSAIAVVAAYCVGMALFTAVMGNAFAAFAVITAGIGIPLVVKIHGADPAILGPMGMLAGYCGTLLTPMAANFNIVPTALLEMKDRYGVIKAQAPVAIVMLIAQIALVYFIAL